MPNETITGLNGGVQLTTPASDDVIPVTDVSDTTEAATGTTKPIELSNLVAEKVRESAGPTVLTLGAVADGEFLKRDGTTIVSDTVASGPATQIEESGGPTTLDIGSIVDGEFLKRVGTDIVSASVPGGAEAGANSDITSMDGLTGPLETPTRIALAEVAAPSTPPAGTVYVYVKSDGKVYIKDDTGTETDLTGGGSAAIDPLHLTDANTVEQYNSTTGQIHRLYATRTSATNYEALKTYFDSGNGAFRIEAEKGGDGGSFRRIFVVVSSGIYQFNDTSLRPPGDNTTHLGDGGNYWNQIFGNDYVVRSGGRVRFAGAARLFSPANGILNFKNDSENPGSGTFRFDARTPSTITSDQNNYDISVPGYFVRLATDASRNLTGLTVSAGVGDGQVHLLVNVGSNNIVLVHESASSTAANRFLTSTGADITLSANQAAEIIYDGTTQRWRVFKRN